MTLGGWVGGWVGEPEQDQVPPRNPPERFGLIRATILGTSVLSLTRRRVETVQRIVQRILDHVHDGAVPPDLAIVK